MAMKVCPWCGKEFKGRVKQAYCSDSCTEAGNKYNEELLSQPMFSQLPNKPEVSAVNTSTIYNMHIVTGKQIGRAHV